MTVTPTEHMSTPPGSRTPTVRLEGRRAFRYASGAYSGPSGVRTLDDRGLKVRRSAAELMARALYSPDLFTVPHARLLSWARQGLNLRVSSL
jgi:hypothetical protein